MLKLESQIVQEWCQGVSQTRPFNEIVGPLTHLDYMDEEDGSLRLLQFPWKASIGLINKEQTVSTPQFSPKLPLWEAHTHYAPLYMPLIPY